MAGLRTQSFFRLIEKEDEYAFRREFEEFQELKEKYMVEKINAACGVAFFPVHVV